MKRSLKNRLLMLSALLLLPLFALAQSQTVTGVVKDSQGDPLVGAGVFIKGTSQGTVTDADGKFGITASSGQILEISHIGYKPKDVNVDRNDLEVILSKDPLFLDDVVVIGYGRQSRKDISSSIATVTSKDFNMSTYTDIAHMLQGRVTGVSITRSGDPNGKGSISLRGASSLRAGAAMEPYYVVDGIPGISLSSVSSDDIESIDILRDASATAIYGSKAANGVIIVTTKKGHFDEKPTVSYSGYAAWDWATRQLDMMTADELREYARQNNFVLPNDEGANTNWQKEVLHTGFKHNHNISVYGGTKHSQYSASLNYSDCDGVVKTTGNNTLSGRASASAKCLKDHLEVSININGSISNHHLISTGDQGVSPLMSMYYFSPLCPVKNKDGTWYDGTGVTTQNYNPMSTLYENTYKTKDKNIQGIGKVAVTIIDGLVWNTTVSYQNDQYLTDSYQSSKSQLPSAKGKNGVASREEYENAKTQLETYISYDKLFKGKHKLEVMAGYSWEQSDNQDGFGLSAYNFYNDNLMYYNLGLANSYDIDDIHSTLLSTLRMVSFYGRVNYSYDSRYIIQFSIRRDGSSAFGSNNRWGTFPSVSFAWRIIQENFMKNQNVLSDLKLRVGYGVSGNSLGFDAYTARETYGPTDWFNYTSADGVVSSYRTLAATNNANPDLRWERTAMLNIGIDFGFFGNRLTGTIECYGKETSDLIYWYPVSPARYPYTTMTANVGNINNRGIEIALTGIPVKRENFVWRTSLNLSHNRNEVETISNDLYSRDYVDMMDPGIGGYSGVEIMRLQEGYPIGSFFLYEWAGYNSTGTSVFNDYDDNGNLVGTTSAPAENDRRYAGSAQPVMTYGWNNDFTWKRWSLNIFFQGTIGNKIYNATRNYFSNPTLSTSGKNILASVSSDQKFGDACAQCPSDRYLEDGSYLRLATLQLSYSFGKIANWIDDITLYVSGNNLFTITKYKGTDPEVNLGGLTPGIDDPQTRYPVTRSLQAGVKFKF